MRSRRSSATRSGWTIGSARCSAIRAVKIPTTWRDKGEYAGFNAHLRNVALQFPHVELHPDIWLTTRPPTSTSAHLFMTAVQQWQHERDGEAVGLRRAAVGLPLRVLPGLPRHCALGCSMRTGRGAGRRHRRDRKAHSRRHRLCETGVRLPGRRQDAHRRQPELRPERGTAETLRQCRLPDHRSQHPGIIAGAGRRPGQLVLNAGRLAPYATSSGIRCRGRARRSATYSTTM